MQTIRSQRHDETNDQRISGNFYQPIKQTAMLMHKQIRTGEIDKATAAIVNQLNVSIYMKRKMIDESDNVA